LFDPIAAFFNLAGCGNSVIISNIAVICFLAKPRLDNGVSALWSFAINGASGLSFCWWLSV
jgi:hypothetical protein